MQLYTIGHSNHTPEKFVKLLQDNSIDLVADVRSTPYSQWAAFANRENLEKLLASLGIYYLYLGDALGGHMPDLTENNKTERIKKYDVVRQEQSFRDGISQLMDKIDRYNVCILCAEEDPISCHRRLLVGKSITDEGIELLHIRGDGQIQSESSLWKQERHISQNQSVMPF